MSICYLFDIDLIERHTYPTFPKLPNHALLKFSDYFKKRGYSVRLIVVPKDIPLIYNPNNVYIGSSLYSGNLLRFKKRLQKKITRNQLKIDHIHIGTPTDYCPITDMKGIKADYSIYDEMIKKYGIKLEWYPTNIGFLTRGCKRHCSFCVNRDKSEITPVNTLEEIYVKKGYDIELLDDNLLASDNATEYFTQIANFGEKNNVKFHLRNGLDLRVKLDDELLLSLKNASKYFNSFHMAWDNVRNTPIYSNICKYRKNVRIDSVCYTLTGVNIYDREELYKDFLGIFYRWYLLRIIGVKPYIALFEDDTGEYINPYWNLYKTIKLQYGSQKTNNLQHIKRKLNLSRVRLADEVINILGDYSWLVEQPTGEVLRRETFDDDFKDIAKEIGVRHKSPPKELWINFRDRK